MTETIRLLVIATIVVVASVTDLRVRRIPNALTVPAMGAGILLWWPEGGVKAVGLSFVCAFVTLLAGLAFQAAGVVGGGDVKLLAAVAALSRWELFREILVWTALFGGAAALLILASRRALVPLLRNLAWSSIDFLRWGTVRNPVEGEGHKIAYAVIIAGGALLAIVATRNGYRWL